MGRMWKHEVNEKWLEARKNFVTATEMRDLLPKFNKATKMELAGTKVNEYCLALWAEKHEAGADPASFGAAARGHVLEPYAVQEFNDLVGQPVKFQWADDFLIHDGFLSFSPDAMDVPQPKGAVTSHYSELEQKPEHILEIKSYSAKNHIKALLTDKNKLPERYQLAGAMSVCPSIETATIFFYNPSCSCAWHHKVYTRDDLEVEIQDLRLVSTWVRRQFNLIASLVPNNKTSISEEQIYQNYLETIQVDPMWEGSANV